MQQEEQAFPPASQSVSGARRFVAGVLGRWQADGLVWQAQQIVSELATNAVLHAATPFSVAVSLDTGVLRIEVRDDSSRAPRQRHYSAEATTGRGLALVASIARAWGVQHGGEGKTIWCELVESESEAELDLESFLSDDDVLDLGVERAADPPDGAARACAALVA